MREWEAWAGYAGRTGPISWAGLGWAEISWGGFAPLSRALASVADCVWGGFVGVGVELSLEGVELEWVWGVDLLFCWTLFIFFSLFITFSGSVAWVAGFPDEFFLLSVWLGDASGLLSVVFLLRILIFFSFSLIVRFAATSGAGSIFENPSDRVF